MGQDLNTGSGLEYWLLQRRIHQKLYPEWVVIECAHSSNYVYRRILSDIQNYSYPELAFRPRPWRDWYESLGYDTQGAVRYDTMEALINSNVEKFL